MRAIAIGWISVIACGGPAIAPTQLAAIAPSRRAEPEPDRPPVDAIDALTPDDDADVSWVVPGPIALELGGTSIGAAGSGQPIKVGAIDRQGNLERVAVRLEHARFSAWIDRARMLSVLTRDQRLEVPGASAGGEVEVVLRAGAKVLRLAHRDHSTRVRYLDALQVEGWVPDAALGERGHARDGNVRIPTGRRMLMVTQGAVIRAEPRWAASELAIVANGSLLDTIREVDDAWTEVGYEDSDVAVRGFVSRRDPPGRVHRWRDGDSTLPALTPNTTAVSGTCLYARAGGDAIGYVVGNRAVDLDDAGSGWWTVTLDTPWGPVGFAARGQARTELTVCAPPGSVPPGAAPTPTP